MIAYLEIIRPANCLIGSFAVYVASIVAGLSFFPAELVLIAMAVVFFVTAAGMVVNDFFDKKIDKINRPFRPIPSGKISSKNALIFSSVLFIVGISLSFLINLTAFGIALFSSLFLILYSWKLKKILLVGHLSVSFLTALTFIYGGIIYADSNLFAVLILAALAFLVNTGREIFKSIEDILGDEKSDVNSLPIKYGTIKAKMVASFFILISVATSFLPFFLGIFNSVYLFFVVIANIIFVASIIAPTKLAPKLCKIAMSIALIAFFAGTYALEL